MNPGSWFSRTVQLPRVGPGFPGKAGPQGLSFRPATGLAGLRKESRTPKRDMIYDIQVEERVG